MNFIISREQVEKLVSYLFTRPYKEVYGLIEMLSKNLKTLDDKINPDFVEKDGNKKNSSTLVNLEVKLNKDGTISFDYDFVDPDTFVSEVNRVNPDYPHTHTIAAMIRNTVNELEYVGSEMQKLLRAV